MTELDKINRVIKLCDENGIDKNKIELKNKTKMTCYQADLEGFANDIYELIIEVFRVAPSVAKLKWKPWIKDLTSIWSKLSTREGLNKKIKFNEKYNQILQEVENMKNDNKTSHLIEMVSQYITETIEIAEEKQDEYNLTESIGILQKIDLNLTLVTDAYSDAAFDRANEILEIVKKWREECAKRRLLSNSNKQLSRAVEASDKWCRLEMKSASRKVVEKNEEILKTINIVDSYRLLKVASNVEEKLQLIFKKSEKIIELGEERLRDMGGLAVDNTKIYQEKIDKIVSAVKNNQMSEAVARPQLKVLLQNKKLIERQAQIPQKAEARKTQTILMRMQIARLGMSLKTYYETADNVQSFISLLGGIKADAWLNALDGNATPEEMDLLELNLSCIEQEMQKQYELGWDTVERIINNVYQDNDKDSVDQEIDDLFKDNNENIENKENKVENDSLLESISLGNNDR